MTTGVSSETCNCAALRQAARHVTQLYDRHLAACGLTTNQYAVLNRLDRHGPTAVNRLAAMLGTDRTTLGRNLKPLERDGLLGVESDPSDGRRRVLVLTDAGRERLRTARPLWSDAQRCFEASFGAKPAGDLRAVLAQLVATKFSPLSAS